MDSIEEIKKVVVSQVSIEGVEIDRIKRTTSDQSIYIYTKKGVIRISDHHNQKSFDKCLCSIVAPLDEERIRKMITQICS